MCLTMFRNRCGTVLLSMIVAAGVPFAVNATVTVTRFGVDGPGSSSNASGPLIPLQPNPAAVAASDLPAHDATVGTLAGEAGVDGGAATYRIPIVVPPGRAGMQPSLSLNYSSRAGNGIAGVGWGLSGSSLHRCPQTPEQDNRTLGVSYTSEDKLCLDGQRLVAVSGTYGNSGAQYRTEIDSFARVYQVGGSLTSNTACFRVEEKSGRILHYGAVVTGGTPATAPTGCAASSANARVQPSGAAATLSWLVEKVEDRVGNNMLYTYTVFGSGENVLSTVLYTGYGAAAGDRSVVFTYSPRATLAANVSDVSSSYLAGGLTMQTVGLQSIQTKVGTSIVRMLTPTYDVSGFSGRLLMTSIKECATNSVGAFVCHPETKFSTSEGALDAPLTSLKNALPVGTAPDSAASYNFTIIGDLDGDGTREVVTRVAEAGGVHTKLFQMTGDRAVQSAVDFTGILPATPESYADLDGDGRAEVIVAPRTGETNISLRAWNLGRGVPATATAFTTVTTNIPLGVQEGEITHADLDGDGRLDLIVTKPEGTCGHDSQGDKLGVFVYLNNSTGVFVSTAVFSLPTSKLFCLTRSTLISEKVDHLADFNGDGLPDFYLISNAVSTASPRLQGVKVVQNSGGVLSVSDKTCSQMGLNDVPSTPSTDECNLFNHQTTQWVDVNGDGLDDFVIARPGGTWQVRLNKGGILSSMIDTASNVGLDTYIEGAASLFRYAGRLPTSDVDADGKADLMVVSADDSFALRMCVGTRVSPLANGECPAGTGNTFAGGTNAPAEKQCVAYACPVNPGPLPPPDPNDPSHDPENTSLDLPRLFGQTGYRFQWNGEAVFPIYAGAHPGFASRDPSAYHLSMLKFKQTSETTIEVQRIATPLIGRLGGTSAEDVFGDGLTDLVFNMGCTSGQIDLYAPNDGLDVHDGCMVLGDGTHGPATLPDGNPTAPYATTFEAYASINQGISATAMRGKRGQADPFTLQDIPASAAVAVQLPPNLPDLMTVAENGVGDRAVWGIVPLSRKAQQDNIEVYTVPSANGYVDKRHYYFRSSMPVVIGFGQHTGQTTVLPDLTVVPVLLGSRSAIYGYSEAMYNHFGRGFQGFRTIISETATEGTAADIARRIRTTATYHQKFPLTGRLFTTVSTIPNSATKISEEINTWKCIRTGRGDCALGDSLIPPTGTTVYAPFLDTQSSKSYDPDTGVLMSHVDTVNAVNAASADSGWDRGTGGVYGNLVDQLVTRGDDGVTSNIFVAKHTTATTNVYDLTSANQWWVDKTSSTSVTRHIEYSTSNHPLPLGVNAPDQTLTSTFGWNPDRTPSTQSQSGTASPPWSSTKTYPSPSYGLPTQVTIVQTGLDTAQSPSRATTYTYTKDGSTQAPDGYFVLTTTNPLSQMSQATTAPRDGQPLRVTDPNNIKTETAYDAFGRVLQVDYKDSAGQLYASSTQTSLTRCTSGTCLGGVGEDGNEKYAAYRTTTVRAGYPTTVTWSDVLGRPIKQATGGFDGRLIATVTDYNVFGEVWMQSTPFYIGDVPTFTATNYDRVGRLKLKVAPGSSLDPTHGDVSSEYAYSGRRTNVTVHATGVTVSGGNCPAPVPPPATATLCMKVQRYTDVLGHLMLTVDAGGRKVNYWNDAQGQVAAMSDANPGDPGVLISATYNAFGHRLTSSDPDQGAWSYTYDALGEKLTQMDARGVITTVTARDSLGRVTQQTIVPPGALDAAFQDEWTYDPLHAIGAVGKVIRRRGSNHTTPGINPEVWSETKVYDDAARPISVATTVTEGSAASFTSLQSYETGTGRPLAHTYASGLAVKSDYTAYGYPLALSNDSTHVAYWTAGAQDAWGHVTLEYFANSVTGTQSVDAATGMPIQRAWTGSLVDQINYSYDSFANLKTQTRAGNTETYAYDVRQRLTRSTRATGGIVDYEYAENGNLTRKTDYSAAIANAYTYGGSGCGPHAATGVSLPGSTTATYGCDANGNVISGNTLSITVAADNHPILTGRTSVPTNDPSCPTTSPPSDRIYCHGFQTSAAVQSGSTTWAYTPDGFRYYELSSRGTTLFGRDGYEKTGAVHRHEIGPVIVSRQAGVDTVTTVLTDRLGSTIATVDAGSAKRAYDAFGQVRNGDMSDKPNGTLTLASSIHGFTQHEHADDVQLIHMGGRLYDYHLGRFLSVDPVIQFPTNSQSINPYSYIMNNPLSATDPSGYESNKNECAGAGLTGCTSGSVVKGTAATLTGSHLVGKGTGGNMEFVLVNPTSTGMAELAGALAGMGTNGYQVQSPTGAGGRQDQKASASDKGKSSSQDATRIQPGEDVTVGSSSSSTANSTAAAVIVPSVVKIEKGNFHTRQDAARAAGAVIFADGRHRDQEVQLGLMEVAAGNWAYLTPGWGPKREKGVNPQALFDAYRAAGLWINAQMHGHWDGQLNFSSMDFAGSWERNDTYLVNRDGQVRELTNQYLQEKSRALPDIRQRNLKGLEDRYNEAGLPGKQL